MKKKSGNGFSISTKDGPASVVMLGGGRNGLTLLQRIQKKRFQRRKRYIENHLKQEHHSMEEVGEYLKEKYGFVEIKPDFQNMHEKYYREYEEMRTSFMRRYVPELLERADEAASPVVKGEVSGFDIDLHIYEKESGIEQDRSRNFQQISLEFRYGYIGGSASGTKKSIRSFNKILRDLHVYYGVTQEDIEGKTRRYQELVRTLARK